MYIQTDWPGGRMGHHFVEITIHSNGVVTINHFWLIATGIQSAADQTN